MPRGNTERRPVIIDLFTLYVVVLLKGATLALLWFAIWRRYGDVGAARTWMLANVLGLLGGAVMALETRAGPLSPSIFGNALIIFGFWIFWVGTCQFYDRSPPWRAAIFATLTALLVLVAFDDDRLLRNLIYMVGQGLPLLLTLVLVLQNKQGPGTLVVAVSMAVGVTVLLARFAGLAMHHAGLLSDDSYSILLFCTVMATIFGGFVWNFGFLLLTIDQLHADASALAVVDQLTGLGNRRMFLTRIEAERKQCEITGRSFALMAIDLDRFKSINDDYGHAAGDACLAHFSTLTNARLRQDDLLARMGGDEFNLLLPDTDLEHATRLAGELVELFRAEPLWWYEVSIPLTLSIGVAVWNGSPDADVAEVIEQADRALYLAKRRGRNRYALADDENGGVPLGPLTLAPRG